MGISLHVVDPGEADKQAAPLLLRIGILLYTASSILETSLSQQLAYAGFIAAYGVIALVLVFGEARNRPHATPGVGRLLVSAAAPAPGPAEQSRKPDSALASGARLSQRALLP